VCVRACVPVYQHGVIIKTAHFSVLGSWNILWC